MKKPYDDWVPNTDLWDSFDIVHAHKPLEQPPAPASYIIFKVGEKTYAKNGKTGHIEFSDPDADTVIQSAIDSASPDGVVWIKEDVVDDDWTPPTYTTNVKIIVVKTDRIEICMTGAVRYRLWWSGELEAFLHTATTMTEGDGALIARVSGDTYDRLVIYGSGKIGFGAGTSPLDVALFRTLPGRLRVMSPDGSQDKDLQVLHVIPANKGVNVSVPSGASSLSVTLPVAEPDTNYGVLVTPQWNTTVYVTNKTSTGFTINFGTAPTVASALDWFVYR